MWIKNDQQKYHKGSRSVCFVRDQLLIWPSSHQWVRKVPQTCTVFRPLMGMFHKQIVSVKHMLFILGCPDPHTGWQWGCILSSVVQLEASATAYPLRSPARKAAAQKTPQPRLERCDRPTGREWSMTWYTHSVRMANLPELVGEERLFRVLWDIRQDGG